MCLSLLAWRPTSLQPRRNSITAVQYGFEARLTRCDAVVSHRSDESCAAPGTLLLCFDGRGNDGTCGKRQAGRWTLTADTVLMACGWAQARDEEDGWDVAVTALLQEKRAAWAPLA